MENVIVYDAWSYTTRCFWPNEVELPSQTDAAIKTLQDAAKQNETKSILFLSGGQDVNPNRYGESNRYSSFNDARDTHELALIQTALDLGIPIFALCRGHQIFAVANGGILYQDVLLDSGIDHGARQFHERVITHPILDEPESKNPYASKNLVNTYHHQAVKTPPANSVVAAVAKDGIIESLYYPELKSLTVQWHPEYENMNFYAPAFIEAIVRLME